MDVKDEVDVGDEVDMGTRYRVSVGCRQADKWREKGLVILVNYPCILYHNIIDIIFVFRLYFISWKLKFLTFIGFFIPNFVIDFVSFQYLWSS